jgi:DNA-binding transcriptional LysR family regulator
MSLDPRRVLTFREVARHGSFSRAAEALSLTQPAVSQQIAALERQLGAQVLERGPGGLALTEAGALLLEHADVVSDRLRLAEGQLDELVAAAGSRLRVGAFASAMATMVPAALAQLTAEQPAMKADAVEAGSEELAVAVRAGEVHAAVCFQDVALPRREPEGTVREDLHDESFIAVVPPAHPLAGGGPIGLAELAGEVWTAPSREHLIARACRAAGFEPRIGYVLRDPLGAAALIAAGLAVGLMPELIAREMPGVAFAEVRDSPRRTVYALLPAAGATPLARAFVAALAVR